MTHHQLTTSAQVPSLLAGYWLDAVACGGSGMSPPLALDVIAYGGSGVSPGLLVAATYHPCMAALPGGRVGAFLCEQFARLPVA